MTNKMKTKLQLSFIFIITTCSLAAQTVNEWSDDMVLCKCKSEPSKVLMAWNRLRLLSF
jgi:hypothetical protein